MKIDKLNFDRVNQNSAEKASKELSELFIGLLIKELFKDVDIPGSSLERDFMIDQLTSSLSSSITKANPAIVQLIEKELKG